MQIAKKKMALDHLVIGHMDNETIDTGDIRSIMEFGAAAAFSDDNADGTSETDQGNVIHYDDAAIDALFEQVDKEEAIQLEQAKSKSNTKSFLSFARVWRPEGITELPDNERDALSEEFWQDIVDETLHKEREALEKYGRGARKRKNVCTLCLGVVSCSLTMM
jgi:hypothetical protein